MKLILMAAAAALLCCCSQHGASCADYPGVVIAPRTGGDFPASGGTSSVLSNTIATPAIPAWTKQSIPVAHCNTPPTIDGLLDDPCWSTATHHTGFYPVGTVTPIDSGEQTEVWVCADKKHLYVAFHCLERLQSDIHASETARDGDLSHDDFVAFDIDSQNKRHAFSTFQVSARGTQWASFEGGTPGNIAWAGDWKAAARRVPDGWTAEISLPFPLLRYPEGATEFGIDFFRNVSRNTTIQCWPYLPIEGQSATTEGEFLSTFTGMSPPSETPRPTFLSYVLGSAGQGTTVKEGLDVKYPLTTTLTAIGTITPDFQTIEQNVTNTNFSYTEKFLSDSRPFFAEGLGYLPSSDLFYSPRIGQIDAGIKVAGKQDNTSIGFLDTETTANMRQSATALGLQQDLNLFDSVRFDYVRDLEQNVPSNSVAHLEDVYGWERDRTRYSFITDYSPSWVGNKPQDSKLVMNLLNVPVNGRPQFSLSHTDIGPNFVSNLGLVPETDIKGNEFDISQYNQFDRGWIQNYSVSLSVNSYQHHTGGFFHNDAVASLEISTRPGVNYSANYYMGRRNELDSSDGMLDKFHDHYATMECDWGRKTLYQQGSIQYSFGELESQTYGFFDVSQNIFASRALFFNFDYNSLKLGSTVMRQAISSFTYKITDVDTAGGRAISQGGDTDIYFSYGRHVRSGNDIFLIFGDPNSPTTTGMITVKIEHVL